MGGATAFVTIGQTFYLYTEVSGWAQMSFGKEPFPTEVREGGDVIRSMGGRLQETTAPTPISIAPCQGRILCI